LLLSCLSLAPNRANSAQLNLFAETIAGLHTPFLADFNETHRLCTAIAGLSANPALTIFIELLMEMVPRNAARPPVRQTVQSDALLEAHRALVQGDRPMARRAFLQHVYDGASSPSQAPARDKASAKHTKNP